MLKRLAKALNFKQFGKDRRGSVKILTAITTPLLLLVAGAGIDTAELYRAKVSFQGAVDAAALMAGKTMTATGDRQLALEAGQELFFANIKNITGNEDDATISFNLDEADCVDKPIVATATLRKKVYFARFRASAYQNNKIMDNQQADPDDERVLMSASTDVQCSNNTLEIALVLDVSGSMGWGGRIGTMRAAATNLVNTLHTTMGEQQNLPDPLKFSVVPFNNQVNVGPANRNATWMDTNGASPIHHEQLNWEMMPGVSKVGGIYRNAAGQAMSRFTLYDQMQDIDWAGCVEARPYPHHTQDTEPTSANPETLFVPVFAPDTPDNWSGENEQTQQTTSALPYCRAFSWWYWKWGRWNRRAAGRCGYWSDGHRGQVHPSNPGYRPHWDDRILYERGEYLGDTSSSVSWGDGNPISEEIYQNNYLVDDHNFPTSDTQHPKSAANTGTSTDPDSGQWGRQKWVTKYFNNPEPKDVNADNAGLPRYISGGGPNAWCNVQAITDLTTDQGEVTSAIASLQAGGATNVQSGVAWGMRTLSEIEPFSNGRPHGASANKKAMIIMTDGANTVHPIDLWYGNQYSKNNKSYYNYYGHSTNGRIFEGYDDISNPTHDWTTFTKAVDHHLVETCQNAKALGIEVYTIAFRIPNGSSIKTMMESCASRQAGGGLLYYDADNNAALIAAFQDIAQELADLRITK